MAGIFVQYITGYSGLETYEERAMLLTNAGFSRLRTETTMDAHATELWALFSHWQAQGPIKGKNEDDIVAWVCRTIKPGQVHHATQTWGLSDD